MVMTSQIRKQEHSKALSKFYLVVYFMFDKHNKFLPTSFSIS